MEFWAFQSGNPAFIFWMLHTTTKNAVSSDANFSKFQYQFWSIWMEFLKNLILIRNKFFEIDNIEICIFVQTIDCDQFWSIFQNLPLKKNILVQ